MVAIHKFPKYMKDLQTLLSLIIHFVSIFETELEFLAFRLSLFLRSIILTLSLA